MTRGAMDKLAVVEEFERQWDQWTSALDPIPEEATRHSGVCGDWTIHDVAGHVHAYARYHLVQARAAWSHLAPSIEEVMGDREQIGPDGGSLHRRNEALRVAGLSLRWQQLLDEAAWLRAHTLELNTLLFHHRYTAGFASHVRHRVGAGLGASWRRRRYGTGAVSHTVSA